MDLACTEKITAPTYAPKDPNIFNDFRVMKHLLSDEVLYTPHTNYFQNVQTDIEPFMRKVVATWMLEVCEEQMCEDQILPLAVNLMDRFLCVCPIRRQQLQLLGATCLLIASKVRSTNILPIDLLCAYTDYSVTSEMLVSWELLVLSKLKWNIAAITGFDFIDQIIERCSWGGESSLLRRHAHTLVSICYTEPSLVQTPPSAIAAACICSAVRGLKLSSSTAATSDVCSMVSIESETLEVLVAIVDNAVDKVVPKTPEKPSKTVEGFESPQYPQPETPTEVENIYF
ncbi:G1/S-specific cyclin-D2 [Tribolium castaneum]|uniref:G1/S-specific cyclin-D3-like Protein n=1 Tax=Tribolium castaneum TaxID=7070 RepID=A0A139WJW6_TRICA|nr:PREDICTED: G1/S-specific cyclin-D2 [Tribolium castaneum]KYB28107.1 G1/S-specific cyclin-D3-like Protein [Tribolium castaneum]|eukprot:XP_974376.1 PREDICTED: G1/S-specific cyclin-D2 [Tribolium castaneum]